MFTMMVIPGSSVCQGVVFCVNEMRYEQCQ